MCTIFKTERKSQLNFRYSKSFVVQGRLRGVRVSRARAQEIKSPVYASLHFFSKNF